ncbi:hypothetical protein [Parabacteroides chinchillae]
MNIDLKFLEPYLIYMIFAFLGLLILYIKTYTTEKAKMEVLKSENKKLIEETERIKKDFQLEISKRRYQYESKKEQYILFFKLLDQFTNEANKSTQEKLLPILDEFNRNFLNYSSRNDKKGENNATSVMSKKIQRLTFEANESLIKIKQETNTIRLIASDRIIQKLDLLELAYDKNMEQAIKMMNDLPKQMMSNDQYGMKKSQREIEISALVIKEIKDEIIELMRKELDEI